MIRALHTWGLYTHMQNNIHDGIMIVEASTIYDAESTCTPNSTCTPVKIFIHYAAWSQDERAYCRRCMRQWMYQPTEVSVQAQHILVQLWSAWGSIGIRTGCMASTRRVQKGFVGMAHKYTRLFTLCYCSWPSVDIIHVLLFLFS